MTLFGDKYKGLKVVVTGDTGFKGSWLVLWLLKLGAEVTGISLDPLDDKDHWNLLDLEYVSLRCDIRKSDEVRSIIHEINPDLVFHLAAQPLVRESYASPLETWAVNTLGTANVLEACREISNLKGVVIVTTDKVYKNQEWNWGYREIDPIGGYDPYSASKAAAELVVHSFRESLSWANENIIISSARAGNVIGGGDWSNDRLIPDIYRSIMNGVPISIRSPFSTRPWQHVLDCLSGYLLIGHKILTGDQSVGRSWNFGPEVSGNKSVEEIVSMFQTISPDISLLSAESSGPHEAKLLFLDISDSSNLLNWKPVWDFREAVSQTAGWYNAFLANGKTISEIQLNKYLADALSSDTAWTTNSK